MKIKFTVNDFLQTKLVLNFIVTIILAVTEEIMELEFICAPYPYNVIYFCIFLVFPSGIFFFLNLIIQGFVLNTLDVENEKWYCVLWQTSFSAWMWFVIVLLDGRYAQCAWSTNHTASTKPSDGEVSAISKMIGLGLFLLITMVITYSYYVRNSRPELTSSADTKRSTEQKKESTPLLLVKVVGTASDVPEDQSEDKSEAVPGSSASK
ncbi:uncharacterized protein [Erythrolamprus reginae]|uniref:uncharacterized protein n=1 Tax=Erythrolamprus reginae TaxID=121349 RepID=UPI00396CE507